MDSHTATPRPPRPRAEPRRAHERRRPAVNAVRDELIRRGLPARQAVRFARELQAHREDLRDGLLAGGAEPDAADAQADERLGTVKELVAAAVHAHRRERFGGRHPVFAYVLAPFTLAPAALIAFVLLVVLPLALLFGEQADDDDSAQPLPPVSAQEQRRDWNVMFAAYGFWHAWAYAVPAGLAVVCHRRALRATLSARWAWAASAAVAVGAGFQRVHLLWVPDARPAQLRLGFGGWPEPSIVAAVLTSAALAAWLTRRNARTILGQEETLMKHMRRLASVVLFSTVTVACLGCAGRGTTRVWTEKLSAAPTTRPADRIVVVLRVEPDGFWDRGERKELSENIGRSVRGVPHTTIVDFAPSNRPGAAGGRAADAEALRVAREQGADRACVVDVRNCWTTFLIPLLPPGWALENHLNYSVRSFDVATGDRVFSRTRFRRDGGLYAVHVPDLQKYMDRGLRQDLADALAAAPAAPQ